MKQIYLLTFILSLAAFSCSKNTDQLSSNTPQTEIRTIGDKIGEWNQSNYIITVDRNYLSDYWESTFSLPADNPLSEESLNIEIQPSSLEIQLKTSLDPNVTTVLQLTGLAIDQDNGDTYELGVGGLTFDGENVYASIDGKLTCTCYNCSTVGPSSATECSPIMTTSQDQNGNDVEGCYCSPCRTEDCKIKKSRTEE